MTFEDALPLILRYEGGKVDDPADRGGRTAFGITQRTYDSARTRWKLPIADVWTISQDEVARIYREDFWVAAHCDALAWPASLCQFDAAVQHGVGNATTLLQRAGGVALEVGRLVRQMLRVRRRYYLKIVQSRPAQVKFLLGWLLRVEDLNDRCVLDHPEIA